MEIHTIEKKITRGLALSNKIVDNVNIWPRIFYQMSGYYDKFRTSVVLNGYQFKCKKRSS
jgi:hypothetical protein